ncbi:ammonium transporter [Coraliomargarita akajimensis]|uniref:Ammonium transporter n=1 Tax=Coraliomargarita akajimensis (strain DSM 45221 / IAM 15411 / JCM 23193 / KCTC 12865 / 04OKA010-24) TaxID=583355 RepID=D5EP71_CORAD|nr:ammonium transporter [Coraliomargarita akajimensis]ADE55581.1 ammonium transporter [Coraliomargarita akajimensis DSM 45221]
MTKILRNWLVLALFMVSGALFAQDVETATAAVEAPEVAAEAATIVTGDTAWMLTATVLVLFMTLPGLALFYGGLVRSQNVLSVLMHCFAIACLASVMWVAGLYSLSFAEGSAWLGGLQHLGLKGITTESVSGTIPETIFVMFQMTFAIITPGLIVGAFVERMKFSAVLLFTALWLVLVYAPVTHWVWGGGWLQERGVIDLAGGIVVHATAGISALLLAKFVGPREGFPKKLHVPHSPGMVMIGASMLWVGWFGFNAGSQVAANEAAGMTMLVTHISAAVASLTWMTIEWLKTGKPGLVGIVTGMVAGLATITPASGNVGPMGAICIGFLAGVVCYFMCSVVKSGMKIDDSLDVFAVHGVGGIMGTILVAVFGTAAFGGSGVENVGEQLVTQLIALAAVVAWSAIATVIIVVICKATTGLRVSEEQETTGLDRGEHGETAYHFE